MWAEAPHLPRVRRALRLHGCFLSGAARVGEANTRDSRRYVLRTCVYPYPAPVFPLPSSLLCPCERAVTSCGPSLPVVCVGLGQPQSRFHVAHLRCDVAAEDDDAAEEVERLRARFKNHRMYEVAPTLTSFYGSVGRASVS